MVLEVCEIEFALLFGLVWLLVVFHVDEFCVVVCYSIVAVDFIVVVVFAVVVCLH